MRIAKAVLTFTLAEVERVLFSEGFCRRKGREQEYDHPGGASAVVGLDVCAGEMCPVNGSIYCEVLCVRVTPADGGYPTEYRRHFSPTFRTLVEFGPAI